MNYKRFLGAASVALMIVIAVCMLAPGAGAQSTYKMLHAFKGTIDSYPHAPGLTFDAAGNLYGTTATGGTHGDGMVFELTPNANGTWTEHILHSFKGDDGKYPEGSLLFDATGNLYGTTECAGGSEAGCGDEVGSGGTVFKLAPNSDGTWTESTLYIFTGEGGDGANPDGSLIFDAAGNLYGTTEWGGGGMGSVFQLTPNSDGSWTEHTLFGFVCCEGPNGSYPWSVTLVFDAAGNLYGTTAYGGNPGCSPRGNGCYGLGLVFELTPNSDGSWSEKILHKFTAGKDGATPTGRLVFDAAGNLYGTTFWGGAYKGNGNVFELTPNADGTWTQHVLHQFTGGKDGGWPFAGVVFDAAGNLYGTAKQGGDLSYCNGVGCGVVFKLAPNSKGGWKETVLHAFIDRPGAYPYSDLIFDAAGNLYGTTQGDGTKTFGSVFEITP